VEERKRVQKYIIQMSKIIGELLNSSEELHQLLKQIESEGYKVNIGFVTLVSGGEVHKKAELRFELTDKDKEFLKNIGIRYDEGDDSACRGGND